MSDMFQTPAQVRAAYENGLPGWQFNQETMDALMADRKALLFAEAAPHLAGVAGHDYRDAVAVEWAVATMTDRTPQPNPPSPYRCPRCKDTGWITHGDGHRTPCPDCSDGSSAPYGGPLDTLREAKELIRKGNELADRGKALLDAAEREGKITVDVHLPKSESPPVEYRPAGGTCPGGFCPYVPPAPSEGTNASDARAAGACSSGSCSRGVLRRRPFWRFRR